MQKPVPLVMEPHAFTSNPIASGWYTGWKEIAERECFVMVWPIGRNFTTVRGGWNVTGGLQSDDYGTEGGNNVTTVMFWPFGNMLGQRDETLFLKTVIDNVVTTFSNNTTSPVVIDKSRIYMEGHSNGGMLSLAMAAMYSDTIAAVAIFAGALITPFPEDYSGVPIWWVHPRFDPSTPYDGAVPWPPTSEGRTTDSDFNEIAYALEGLGMFQNDGGLWSMDQTLDYLSKQNKCLNETIFDRDGDTVTRLHNCRQNATVELLTLDATSHHPYNYDNIQPDYCLGYPFHVGCFQDRIKVNTTELAWEFLSSHSNSATESEPDNGVQPASNIDSDSKPTTESGATKTILFKLSASFFFSVVVTLLEIIP